MTDEFPEKTSNRMERKKIVLALCLAGFTLFVCGQQGAGFMVILPALLWVPWLLVSVWKMMRYPPQRAVRALCIGVWIVTFACIAGIHTLREKTTRKHADAIVAEIKAYRALHQQYPATLDVLGVSKFQLTEQLGQHAMYGLPHPNQAEYAFEAPNFVYFTSFNMFDRYFYDFKADKWEFKPD